MVYQTEFEGLKLFKKGKVRDVYELGDNLLIVATDRISCFDVVLPTPIPDKGKVLTQISRFWFSFLKETIGNHLVTTSVEELPQELVKFRQDLEERFMLVRKCQVIPFECVVRGYLSGSGWKEYKEKESVCGIKLEPGLTQSCKLAEPIFTPATKADTGHDENISYEYMEKEIGKDTAAKVRDISLSLYKKASDYAQKKGIIIADTKFEFGFSEGEIILVDEVLTPDSSRFWPQDEYSPGKSQVSFDKQYVRDYLDSLDWPKTYPGPELPQDIIEKTKEKYLKALKIITG
jgi:phosphoribosylaminoimidazole-succinocarboxamide synthase